MTSRARSAPPERTLGESRLAELARRLVEACVILVGVATPLFVDLQNARRFEPIKVALVRSIVLVALFALAVRGLELRRLGPSSGRESFWNRAHRALRVPLVAVILLVLLVQVVSTALGLSPRVSLWGSHARLQGLYSIVSYMALALCVATCIRSRDQIERLVSALIVTSIPVALIGIAQRYGLDPLGLMQDPRRVASTLGAPNFAGSYVTLVLPWTLVRLIGAVGGAEGAAPLPSRRSLSASLYGFALAVQLLLAVFTQSRGPMLGILGACFVLGLCVLLHLRRSASDRSRLSAQDLARGCGAALLVGAITGALGAAGALAGWSLERVLLTRSQPFASISTLGLGAGAAVGFALSFAIVLRDEARRRRAWITWLATGIGALLCIFALNLRGTTFDRVLDPLRSVPFLGRLAKSGEMQSGSVQVRLLIWEAALRLASPHAPLGIPGSDEVPPDRLNALRPFVGYGPDSLINTFAAVEPPELAHLEAGGSTADRAHNETIDNLVMTGLAGALASYLLWGALLSGCLSMLGWLPDLAAHRRLIGWMVGFGTLGAALALLVGGGWTLVPLGLPFGMLAGVVAHLAFQGFIAQPAEEQPAAGIPLLEIGLFGALCGYLIQVHFLFPVSVTATCFWICVGLLLALRAEKESRSSGELGRDVGERAVASDSPASMAAHGMSVATAVAVLAFASQRTELLGASGRDRAILFLILLITWAVSFGIASAEDPSPREARAGARGTRSLVLHGLAASSGLLILLVPFVRPAPELPLDASPEEALRRAELSSRGFVCFLALLLILAAAMAAVLSSRRSARSSAWKLRGLAVYAPLALLALLLLWSENVDVVRAGIFLEAGDRQALRGRWKAALALHEKARALDGDEARYSLALAKDYQELAQDPRTPAPARREAWSRGEAAALEARRINPYDVDNTANLGRYSYSFAAAVDRERFARALNYFDQAISLAPFHVEFQLLAAQTLLASQDPRAAIARLERAVNIDPENSASWILLGDAHLAVDDADQALHAHRQAMTFADRANDGFGAFADAALDERLRSYLSAGSLEPLLAALHELASLRPEDPRIPWAIGRAYQLDGQVDRAHPHLERATQGGFLPAVRDLAAARFSSGSLAEAEQMYVSVLEHADDLEARRGLAQVLAAQGRIDEAIQQMMEVLRQLPDEHTALEELADLHCRAGRPSEAAQFAARAASSISEEARRE